MSDDPVAQTLDDVAATADADADAARRVAAHARELADNRRAGRSGSERFSAQLRELLRVTSSRAEQCARSTLALRRAWAHGLRNDGLSVREIARHFGVSHQRVSVLLSDRSERAPGG